MMAAPRGHIQGILCPFCHGGGGWRGRGPMKTFGFTVNSVLLIYQNYQSTKFTTLLTSLGFF